MNAPELAVALPTGVFCKPPKIVSDPTLAAPEVLMLPATKLPVTPKVVPMVAELLTVNALAVKLPLAPIVVP